MGSEFGLPSTKERPLLEKELDERKSNLEENESEALSHTAEHLPFMVLMPLLERIENRLVREEELVESEKVRKEKLEQANFALKTLDHSSIEPPLLSSQKACLSSLLMEKFLCDKEVSHNTISLHFEVLSQVDRKWLIEEMREEIKKTRQNHSLLAHLKKSYKENQMRIEEIKRTLKGLPTGTQLTEQEKDLEDLMEKQGLVQQSWTKLMY